MPCLPRVALGTIQPAADGQAVAWALMDALARGGLDVQHFLARACFAPLDGAGPICGRCTRHLDSWLMSAELCREVFGRAAAECDLAVVEGRFSPPPAASVETGSRLETLCDWLDLPRLVVVDVARIEHCRLPARPERADGLLLDGVTDESHLVRLRTVLESLWGVPVLGGLPLLPRLRDELSALPAGSSLPTPLAHELGDQFRALTPLERVRRLAQRRALPQVASRVFRPPRQPATVRVAIAHDAAFHCYFPDTLDLLELRGATIATFSPLRDDDLPAETDIVYLGCGHPERFAGELAANHCMATALRNHLCAGRRIYAEGGGLAYLCAEIETAEGCRHAMAGALPATAVLDAHAWPPEPVQVTLSADNWLGAAGSRLRGYRSRQWHIRPSPELKLLCPRASCTCDLVGRHHAIGSTLHVNFAAQPHALSGFLRPHAASLELTACRSR